MIDPTTKPSDVLQPFIAKLLALGITVDIYLSMDKYGFNGFFDLNGPDHKQFSGLQTWGDVERMATEYVREAAFLQEMLEANVI